MAKFRFLLINEDLEVSGTNDQATADHVSEHEDWLVIDVTHNEVISEAFGGAIKEAKASQLPEQEDDEDSDEDDEQD